MSWDPNQPQGQPQSGPGSSDPAPQNPYSQPPQSTPQQNIYEQPAQSPYMPPSAPNPYEQAPQPGMPPSTPNPYGQPPYVPPSAPNPYEQPSQPQNPYGQPQNPYAPPAQPYGQAAFGAPAPQPNYGYASQGTPLPLGQAIQGLPAQYLKILTKPNAQSFAEEQGKAEWGIIWLQLIFVGLIGTIIGLISAAVTTAALANANAGPLTAGYGYLSTMFLGGTSVYSLFSVIAGFFIIVGIQYLLAKMFKGTGNFKEQAYNYLLFYVPITVVGNIVGLIPFLGGLVGFALGIYSLVLNVFSIMAAHRLSGGKATGVVLIPIAAIILLVILCAVVIFALFASAIHGAATPQY